MKSTIIKLLFVFFLVSCSQSCTKDDFVSQTSGELIAKELQTTVNENNIKLASLYRTMYVNSTPYVVREIVEQEFIIRNGFFIINNQYYNLETLKRFEIVPLENYKIVELYFN